MAWPSSPGTAAVFSKGLLRAGTRPQRVAGGLPLRPWSLGGGVE